MIDIERSTDEEFSAWMRHRAAELIPELPDGYIVYQQKNELWVGKSPNRDFIVKSDDHDEVIYWLRLNVLNPPR